MSNPLKISVGMSTCNIAAGSRDVFRALEKQIADGSIAAELSIMGCLGMCHAEPQLRVTDADGTETLYEGVNLPKLGKISVWVERRDNRNHCHALETLKVPRTAKVGD